MQRRILAVGMLPPPVGGQALMFERAICALAKDYDVRVIDTQLQSNIGESGRFSLRKVVKVFKLLLFRMTPLIFAGKYDFLYYCLSGPSTFGVVKDLLFLSVLRARVRKTVYHFHAGGGVAFVLRSNALIRALARLVLFQPDLVLHPPYGTPDDASLCKARKQTTIYNAIEDPAPTILEPPARDPAEQLRFIFIGAVTEEKGIFDLVEIMRLLRDKGHRFTLYIVGEGAAGEILRLDALIDRHALTPFICRTGVLTGVEKFKLLKESTVFVFPTYFRAETQTTAVIEAIALGIPVVASDWRGLNTIIDHGVNGYLVPPRDTVAFCEAIEQLLSGGDLERMRAAARRIFLERFSIEKFGTDLRVAFDELGAKAAEIRQEW